MTEATGTTVTGTTGVPASRTPAGDATGATGRVPPQPATGSGRTPTGRTHRLLGMLRGHPALVVAVILGAVLRVLVGVGYGAAFFVWPDSGVYLSGARTWVPGQIWPFGYSVPLALLRTTGWIGSVAAVQHLAGLALAVLLYAVLHRAGLPRWLATLAVLPILLDAQEIVLEHYVLAETTFMVAAVGALLLLTVARAPGGGLRLGAARPAVWRLVAAGVLLAYAALTRTAGLPILVLPLLYLLIRRVGWLRLAAFAISLAIPLLGYVVWYHADHGVYGFNQTQGRFLWARTTSFVDCSRLNLTPAERSLCPPGAPNHRLQPDKYLWEPPYSPMNKPASVDPLYQAFAVKAILAQPVGYATAVARDTYHFFDPAWRMPGRTTCVSRRWQLPAGPTGLPSCRPKLANQDFSTTVFAADGSLRATPNAPVGMRSTPLTRALHAYSVGATTPRLLLLAASMLAVGLALLRPRRIGWPGATGLLFVLTGAGLILVAIATAAIDPRYAAPSLPMVFPGAALVAWRALRDIRPAASPPATVAFDDRA